MDNNEVNIFNKCFPKATKNKVIYYVLIIIFLASGFLVNVIPNLENVKWNSDFKTLIRSFFDDSIYWYDIFLIDLDYENPKNYSEIDYLLDSKYNIEGMYIYMIIALIFMGLFLMYLPIFLGEFKKRIYNNTYIKLKGEQIVGTKNFFFKMKEYIIDIDKIEWIEIKKNKFKSIFGTKKIIIYANEKIYKINYLENVEKVKELINTMLEAKGIKLDEKAFKDRIKNRLSRGYNKIAGITEKIYENINTTTKDVVSKQIKSDLEKKLEKIQELKDNGTINEEEYNQLRTEIFKNAKL